MAAHALAQELPGPGPMPARLYQDGARHRLDIALEGLTSPHGGRRVDAVGEQGGGLREALAQPNLQEYGLVADTRRLSLSEAAFAAAPEHCPSEGDGASCNDRHELQSGLREPTRQLPDRIDGAKQEPSKLHSPPPTPPPPVTDILLRQRDELLVVTRHEREAVAAPIFLGLLDALFGGRDEIPPDVTRAVHGRAAEQHQPRLRHRQDRDAVSRLEGEQPALTERVAGNVDFT